MDNRGAGGGGVRGAGASEGKSFYNANMDAHHTDGGDGDGDGYDDGYVNGDNDLDVGDVEEEVEFFVVGAGKGVEVAVEVG